ncbi:MAG: alpha-N-arabinofuranosidase [Butyrivibrio sp.]|nr:alpha-N-arabinofuranosidase [Butyrivibrio sp.]
MKKAKIIYDRDFAIGNVDRRLFGSFVEHLGRCMYGGIYQPNHESADERGFREDVKKLVKEVGITGVRYPGGNFVSGYDWKDGIGPKENRPHKKDMAWNTIETNEVGTDEFLGVMEEMGIETHMTVNLGTGTPKEAGELVDYCNTKEGTFWSDKRRENGHTEPYKIKHWYMGNEMDGFWQIGMKKPEEYARVCRETAKIVKWMDPTTETIACGSCTNELGHDTYGIWDQAVLEECYDVIDYLSLHRYYNYYPEKHLAYPNEQNESDIPYMFRDLQNYLDTVIGVCDFVKGKKRTDKQINISFDEWGVITDTGAVPGGVAQEYKFASFKEMDAMIYGGILCTFLNNADRVKIACQSLLVNEGGMISTDPEGHAIRQATFYPFKDAAMYARGKALRPCAEMPKVDTDHHGLQDSIVMSCTYDEENGEVAVFITNCDMKEDTSVELELRSFGELKAIGRKELYHEDPYATNTFDDEFKVVPYDLPLSDPEKGKISIEVKAHSWNLLRFRTV